VVRAKLTKSDSLATTGTLTSASAATEVIYGP